MRIGIDGERGFCFGVDEQWQPLSAPPDQLDMQSLAKTNKRSGEEELPAEMVLALGSQSAHSRSGALTNECH
jgi:hypothetical protein